MTLLHIHTLPDPVLREKAKPVAAVDSRVLKLTKDMLETMYANHGIGLAANQVGILERIVVLDLSEKRDGTEALLLINPEVVDSSEETFTYNEGCLSVRPTAEDTSPDLYANVTRPKRVKVRYLDDKGDAQEIEAEDLLSTALQHEIDHLNGILFIDHLSALKRNMLTRKIEKARRLEAENKAM
jgi:peptide deformylase